MTSGTCRRCEISKKLTWNPTLTTKNTPLFLFLYMGHSLQIFAWGMPLPAHVFSFTHNAVVLSHFRCVHPEIQTKMFLNLTFLWIKTNVAYTRLEVIAKQCSALQVEFITCVKLICYFILYYCFLHWAHPPNMAVGDLDFYYTLYLWLLMYIVMGNPKIFLAQWVKCTPCWSGVAWMVDIVSKDTESIWSVRRETWHLQGPPQPVGHCNVKDSVVFLFFFFVKC